MKWYIIHTINLLNHYPAGEIVNFSMVVMEKTQMQEKETVIERFCKEFKSHLSEEAEGRLGHHLVHVSPEPWLILESAYAVNRTPGILPGFRALAERGDGNGKIDVRLIQQEDGQGIRLEFKTIQPWRWKGEEIREELERIKNPRKPRADACICLVLDHPSPAPPPPYSPRTYKVREYDEVMKEPLIPGAVFSLPLRSGSPEMYVAEIVCASQEWRVSWPPNYVYRCRLLALRVATMGSPSL